jgi:hypothetical protein
MLVEICTKMDEYEFGYWFIIHPFTTQAKHLQEKKIPLNLSINSF